MITTTYLLLVAVLGIAAWRLTVRHRRAGRAPGTTGPGATRRWRALLTGLDGDDDLVERMAACLVAHTTVFGSSHAIPSHLGAELPGGVYEAATACRERLTAEIVERYCSLMDERSRRLDRSGFVLPERYRLHLALTRAPAEVLTASFEPIVDVRSMSARVSGGARPVPAGALVAPADATRRRVVPDEMTARRLSRDETGHVVVLDIGGVCHGQSPLDRTSPVAAVGRGPDAALRCPDDLHEVSRVHAELTFVDGRCFVEDRYSANGSSLGRGGADPVALVPGEPTAWEPGDVLWLDEDRRVTVTLR